MKEPHTCDRNLNVTPLRLHQASLQALRRLNENGAVMALAENMEKAVIVRETAPGTSLRSAIVEREVAQRLLDRGWMTCTLPGRIARFSISPDGRQALAKFLAEQENRMRGMREAPSAFSPDRRAWQEPHSTPDPIAQTHQRDLRETPVALLARRKDKDGKPFLDKTLVRAAERLFEDYELAKLGALDVANFENLMQDSFNPQEKNQTATARALRRLKEAFIALGPGLADIAHRCCCELEGLESTEQKMGWSARSGKIVLRISLMRLKRHYDMLGSNESELIG